MRNWYTHVEGIGARGVVALVSAATHGAHIDYLQKRNIPIVRAGGDHVDHRAAFSELNARFGSKRIRTDSGGVPRSNLLKERLATELSLLIAPDLIGNEGRDLFRTLELVDALHHGLLDCQRVGESFIWLKYKVQY